MTGQINSIIADMERFAEGEIVALALNVNANLRDGPPLGTPIDTGWASANWVPGVGRPADVDGKGSGPGGKPTSAEIAGRSMRAEQGLSEVLSWRLNDGPIFSSNDVPYIKRLNDGHSDQSPSGFVQIAIETAIRQTFTGSNR